MFFYEIKKNIKQYKHLFFITVNDNDSKDIKIKKNLNSNPKIGENFLFKNLCVTEDSKKIPHVLKISFNEKEFKFLLNYNDKDFLVKMVGFNNNIFFNGIIMEKASRSLQDVVDVKKNEGGDFSPTEFKILEGFFLKVLEFLHSHSFVYGDWKFENILVYDSFNLKLADFETLMVEGQRIENENNINLLCGSPNYFFGNKIIKPRSQDDYKSVCYLFWMLNMLKLPWDSFIDVEINSSNMIDIQYSVTLLKRKDNLFKESYCIYWPNAFYFTFLNKLI